MIDNRLAGVLAWADMNASSNINLPAFPTSHYTGLTKREYFAARAMEGLITACYGSNQAAVSFSSAAKKEGLSSALEMITKTAVEYADLLCAELDKPK